MLGIVKDSKYLLTLKLDHGARAATSRSLGHDKLWSAQTLSQHLSMLDRLVPLASEASARACIDALFFRVAAIVQSNTMSMVLNMEQDVKTLVHPSPRISMTLSGYIDYTVVLASQYYAQMFHSQPTLQNLEHVVPNGFFVTEAKMKPLDLDAHIPQVIGEMFACLKTLNKRVLRGALTNGQEWVFLVIVPNGDGAKYWHSLVIKPTNPQPTGNTWVWSDLVAGILSHWVSVALSSILLLIARIGPKQF
ncbi:hypothetical protein EDB84DRAFT_1267678 [Lactarius hengduanensis]|nr:hypothetical protein EDB84DRAFT_1267678 [Lactarius hengduanensis]